MHSRDVATLGHQVEMSEDVMESPAEEVRELKELKAPNMPTLAEVNQHKVTHLPYRSWCRSASRRSHENGRIVRPRKFAKSRWCHAISCI